MIDHPNSRSAWTRFWFTATDPLGLHVVRIVGGVILLGWLLTFAGSQHAWFGLDGWFDTHAYRETAKLQDNGARSFGWSLVYLCGNNRVLLDVFYIGTLLSVLAFTFGYAVRLTSVLTWLGVLSLVGSPAAGYEADYLLGIVAFYLMVGYLLQGQWSQPLTLAERLLGRTDVPSGGVNLALRLWQLHFALIILVSGFHKLQFGDWWSGTAYWYPLNPPFEMTREKLLERATDAGSYFFWLSLLQYLALAWQLSFITFAWKQGPWRMVLLGGALLGWAGSQIIYRQPVFGPVLLLGCLSYVRAEEWRRLGVWLKKLMHPGKQDRTLAREEVAHV